MGKLLRPENYEHRSEWIALPASGERVLVLTRISGQENSIIQSRVMKGQAKFRSAMEKAATAGDGFELDLDMEGFLTGAMNAALEVGVKEWTFEDELTPENLLYLDQRDREFIKEYLDRKWAGLEPEEKKESPVSTPTGGSEQETPHPTS